jgi:hypothetical protein
MRDNKIKRENNTVLEWFGNLAYVHFFKDPNP